MDRALIIGIILGIAMIGLGIWIQLQGTGESPLMFWSTSSIFIVGGGMIASVFVAFPLNNVIGLREAIGAVVSEEDNKLGDMVDEACDVAEVLAVLESSSTTDAQFPLLELTNLNSNILNAIVGETIVGKTSGASAVFVATNGSNQVSFVCLLYTSPSPRD